MILPILLLLSQFQLQGPDLTPPIVCPVGAQADVLVIAFDDFGHPDLAVTPNVMQLAAEGLFFTRAYSMPVCSSSRFAAMTALLPRRFGLGDIVNTYQPSQTDSPYPPCRLLTIAESFKASAFGTVMIGKYHLGRCGDLLGNLADVESGPFVQGFNHWRQGSPDSIAFGPGTGYYSWDRVNDGVRSIAPIYATDLQADEFVALWSSTPSPKFFWLAFNAPHGPWDTPPGYSPAATDRERYEQVAEYADARLADVLAEVDLESTYVLFFGDNGTPDQARPTGSASGIWKGTTREGGVHVPLILAGPGIEPGVSSQLVSLLDVTPTLCELAGVEWRGGLDGISFASGPPRTWLFTERYRLNLGQPNPVDDRAVIEADWKLRVFDADGPGSAFLPVEEFYWLGGGGETPLSPSQAVKDRLRAEMASVPPRG